jgi:ABC-type transport system involved in cytochrome c biogenesis permease subunit
MMMKIKTRKVLWLGCCAVMLIATILTFTPLVIPEGIYQPKLLGMPYTLWIGILMSIIMVLLVLLGTLVHPGRNEEIRKN